MRTVNLIIGILLMAVLVTADTAWTRPPATGGGVSLWTESGSDIYYDDGDVGIGTQLIGGRLDVSDDNTTTLLLIDNTAGSGDPQIQWQLSGITKFSLGIDDSIIGDPFIFNYGTGLDTSYEIAIDSTTVTIGLAKFSLGPEQIAASCDTTPSVLRTNIYKTHRTSCSITDFDNNIEGQLLYLFCGRQLLFQLVQIVDGGVGGPINLEGGANFICVTDGDMLHLIQVDGQWWEVSRSFQ